MLLVQYGNISHIVLILYSVPCDNYYICGSNPDVFKIDPEKNYGYGPLSSGYQLATSVPSIGISK